MNYPYSEAWQGIMKYNREIHHRRSIRLQDYDYSQSGLYFVTICTWNRECLFGDVVNSAVSLNEYGRIVAEYFGRITDQFTQVHIEDHVIMPNHVHAMISILSISTSAGASRELPLQRRKQRRRMLLPKIVGWLKMNTSKSINQLRNTEGRPVWQKNYEHVVRNDNDMMSIKEYIINNPLQWELDENNPVNISRGG